MNNWSGLRAELLSAFPAMILREEEVADNAKTDETFALVRLFAGRSWPEISVFELAGVYDALWFLTPLGVKAYIATFLQDVEDEDFDDMWKLNILSFLSQTGTEFDHYFGLLTSKQRQAIANWIKYCAFRSSELCDRERACAIAERFAPSRLERGR